MAPVLFLLAASFVAWVTSVVWALWGPSRAQRRTVRRLEAECRARRKADR